MKRKLLYSALFLGLSVVQVYAQDFDYFTEGKNPALVSDEITGSGTTLGNIHLAVGSGTTVTTDGTGSSLEAVTDGDYVRIGFRGNAASLILTSPNALAKVAFLYRGSNNSTNGSVVLTYGADEASATNTATIGPGAGPAPGVLGEYLFTENNIKYVKITRSTGATMRLYRIAASTTNFTLPLNFLSFTAKPDALGKSVNLNWQTSNEVNTKEFIIEKKIANTEFAAIGSMSSNNTSGIHNYSYTDHNTIPGVAYYRLKQVDNDGIYSYSTVVSADIKGNLNFSIYPNPTTDRLNVVHESALASSTVKILNLSGKTLIENAVSIGSTATDINVSALSTGSYVLLYDGINQQNALKFIKK